MIKIRKKLHSAMVNPFHLAIEVHSLDEAREFYGNILGCKEGRSDAHWVDFNFFGHQISAHLSYDDNKSFSNSVAIFLSLLLQSSLFFLLPHFFINSEYPKLRVAGL